MVLARAGHRPYLEASTHVTARYLIVNADDFGAGRLINRGILECHQRGIVTSASLMVDRPGSEDAAERSQGARGLSVGLHICLTREAGVPRGDFADPEWCVAEVNRQFERFETLMGRIPTHLDTHHNVQRDQRVLPHLAALSVRHALPLREHSSVRYFSEFYGQWDGNTHAEQISPDNLMRLLTTSVEQGITELGCHPGYVDPEFPTSYAVEREMELRTLCDPAVRRFLWAENIRLINFSDLKTVAGGQAPARGTS